MCFTKWICEHLRELVPHFFDLLSFLSNYGAVKLLLYDQVFCAFIFLQHQKRKKITNLKSCRWVHNVIYRVLLCFHIVRLTIRWAMSISSLRASCTPWGSPSIRTSPQRSESWGILTDTLYCSFIRFTKGKVPNNSIFYSFIHLLCWLIKTLLEQICSEQVCNTVNHFSQVLWSWRHMKKNYISIMKALGRVFAC